MESIKEPPWYYDTKHDMNLVYKSCIVNRLKVFHEQKQLLG